MLSQGKEMDKKSPRLRRLKEKFPCFRSKDSLDSNNDPSPSALSQREHAPKRPDSVPVAAASKRDLWEEAFNRLHGKSKEQLYGMGIARRNSQPLKATLDDLVLNAQRKQDECEKVSWKLRVGDNEILLRDYGAKTVTWIKSIGDIAVQFAPPQAAPPWAVIKAVLQIPVAHSEQMLALLGTVERVVQVIHYGQIYELLYTPEQTAREPLNLLHEALLEVYIVSLELLAHSTKYFAKNTAKKVLEAIVDPEKASGMLSQLDDQFSNLTNAAHLCKAQRNAEANLKLLQYLHDLDAPLARIDWRVEAALAHLEWNYHITMLEWISPILFAKHHNIVREWRLSNTCDWLLQHGEFRKWEECSSSAVMWVRGSPGVGKTFITSRVIDHVEGRLQRVKNHEGFAFFYCNRNDKLRTDPLSILQCYLRQLSSAANSKHHVQSRIEEAYKDLRGMGSDLDWTTCTNLLLESLNLYPKSTLVLDALDECDPNVRVNLIHTLDSLISRSHNPVKVFIASRPDKDITNQFLNTPNIEIRPGDNQDDIERFIKKHLVELASSNINLARLKDRIATVLLDNAQGMFQWVALQLQQLNECESLESIENRLGKLPRDLRSTYAEIYEQISNLEKHDRDLADRAFMWVLSAERPLTSDQLLTAIRIDPEHAPEPEQLSLSKAISAQNLLSICKNLLVLDSNLDIWRFSHLSVAEFFEDYWTRERAQYYVARTCLLLLIQPPGEASRVESTNRTQIEEVASTMTTEDILDHSHSLQIYARENWTVHTKRQEGQSLDACQELTKLLQRFLGSFTRSSVYYVTWFDRLNAESMSESGESLRETTSRDLPIVLICYLSLYDTLFDWWKALNIDPLLSHNGESILTLAAVNGSKDICMALVNAGVQINAVNENGSYGSALVAAILGADVEIVKCLVENGADINMLLPTGDYGTALAAAILGTDLEMVQYLVDAGANINMPLPTGDYGSALAAAILGADFKIVKCLVENAADINMSLPTGDYGSALAAAAHSADLETVKFLVEKGADTNMLLCTGHYGSALAAAAHSADLETVKFLVEKGADTNMLLQTGHYGSALAAACSTENLNSVRFLVEAGADVNMPLDGRYGVALVRAAYCASPDIVRYLLVQGASLNATHTHGDYNLALASAIAGWNIPTIRLLVHEGADASMSVRIQSSVYRNALEAAVDRGSCDIIKILVEDAGVDVNLPLQLERFGSVLVMAVCTQDMGIVCWLVEKLGADVGQVLDHGPFGSALAAAAYYGRLNCVKYLLDKGISANTISSGNFKEALAASEREITHERIEKMKRLFCDANGDSIQENKHLIADLLRQVIAGSPCPALPESFFHELLRPYDEATGEWYYLYAVPANISFF